VLDEMRDRRLLPAPATSIYLGTSNSSGRALTSGAVSIEVLSESVRASPAASFACDALLAFDRL